MVIRSVLSYGVTSVSKYSVKSMFRKLWMFSKVIDVYKVVDRKSLMFSNVVDV